MQFFSSFFGSHSVNECPFQGLFSSTLHIFVLFAVDLAALKWPPSVVPKYGLAFLNVRMLLCAFTKELYPSNMSYRAVGHEFSYQINVCDKMCLYTII